MRSHSHCVYKLHYHLVLCTRYRHKCLTGEMIDRLEEILGEQCKKWDVRLVQFNCEQDHAHAHLEMHPNIEPAKFINSIKTVSSRLLRKEFSEHLAQYYWKPTLWSRAYCLVTAGGCALNVLERYIKNQARPL